MLTFQQVCKELKRAEAGGCEINYKIEQKACSNQNLQEKVIAKYNQYWESKFSDNNTLPNLSVIGCCEIGHLTGNQLFRLFAQIFERDDIYEFGNCLYFSINGQHRAAVLFLGSDRYPLFPNLITTPPPTDSKEFRFIFSKLFDDDEVEMRRKHENKEITDRYTEEKIQSLRLKAKQKYFEFLKTRLTDFPLMPFAYSFMGLVFNCAFKESSKNPFTTDAVSTSSLPFAACVKFAFDQNDSGKITLLFGEIGRQSQAKTKEEIFQLRIDVILSKAKLFISR